MSQNAKCMPEGLLYQSNRVDTCPTTNKLLLSIALFNVEVAVCSLILGHARVRQWLACCACSTRWTATTGILTSLVSVGAMLLATLLLRQDGFMPSFVMVFAFWTMRPRASIFVILFYAAGACFSGQTYGNPYLWTLKDHAVEDCLLSTFALPAAIYFILNRPHDLLEENKICTTDSAYIRFWNSFYVIAGVGCIAVLLLVFMLVHWCTTFTRNAAHYDILATQQRNNRKAGLRHVEAPVSLWWKWMLVIAGVNMVGSFAANWIVWSTFVSSAGTDFCPGNVLNEALAWAAALFVNVLIRPVVGGPVS